jgi:dipeptidyl aminopeptidase/acylaminoacyl peptidase
LIAYASGAIHVIRPDGTGDRVLVERVTPCELRWSPDARSLAFTAPSGGCPTGSESSEARIVDLDGTVRTIASPIPGQQVLDLAWSSDGRRLALVVGPRRECSSDTSQSLWVVDADGANPRKVVDRVDCEWPDQGGPDW